MARIHNDISFSPRPRITRIDDSLNRVKYLYDAYGAARPDSLLRDPMVRRLLVRKFKAKQKNGRAQSVSVTPAGDNEKEWSYDRTISPRIGNVSKIRPPLKTNARYRNSSRQATSPEELQASVLVSKAIQRRSRKLAEIKSPISLPSRPRTQASRKPQSHFERVCLLMKSMLNQGKLEGWES